jgi:hypothetical protein
VQVTEYFWQFEVDYILFTFQGNDPKQSPLEVTRRHASIELKTSTESTPKAEVEVRPSLDLSITWLLQHLDEQLQPSFSIDRKAKSCHTPRRNDETLAALDFASGLRDWASSVQQYFSGTLFPVQTGHGLNMRGMTEGGIFVPVQPLFEGNASERKQKDEGKYCTNWF